MLNQRISGLPSFIFTSVFSPVLAVFLIAGLAGCAGILGKPKSESVTVAKSERLLLVVPPFDGIVIGELQRVGIDATDLHRELESELRYRLYARGQQEALDSSSLGVSVKVTVRHWQPGFGNAGTYAAFSLSARRAKEVSLGDQKTLPTYDTTAWNWQAKVSDNAPPAYAVRHLARMAADEVLARLSVPKKGYETPPPLHLMR